MDNIDSRSRSPTPPMLARYLEDDSDLFTAQITGLLTTVRVDRMGFVNKFLDLFDQGISNTRPLVTAEQRRLPTIKEDHVIPSISGEGCSEPSSLQQKHDIPSYTELASNRSTVDTSEFNVEDLALSDIIVLSDDENTPIPLTESAIVYRAVNGKPVASIDSGIYGISLSSVQQPIRGHEILYHSANTQPSSCDSGLDVSSGSLRELHATPLIGLPPPRLQKTQPNGPEGSVSSDTSKASEETELELEDEYPNRRLLTPARKHMLVELVNRNVRTWFGEALQAGIQEAAAIEGGGSADGESRTGLVSQPQAPPNRGSKRKSSDESDDRNEDESDAEEDQPKRQKRKSGAGSEDKREKFACPCFKREPQRYDPGSDCATHVWDIKRLKEHLNRQHLPRFECGRCAEAFCSQGKLSAHLTTCHTYKHKKTQHSPGKLAQERYRKIVDKTAFRGKPDLEKWRKIFQILYPEVHLAHYPSPYLEETTVEKFRDYTSRHLPRLFEAELESESEMQETNSKLVQALRRALVKVNSDFNHSSSLRHIGPSSDDPHDNTLGTRGESHNTDPGEGIDTVWGDDIAMDFKLLDDEVAQMVAQNCVPSTEEEIPFSVDDHTGEGVTGLLGSADALNLPLYRDDSGYFSYQKPSNSGASSLTKVEDLYAMIMEPKDEGDNAEVQTATGLMLKDGVGEYEDPNLVWPSWDSSV